MTFAQFFQLLWRNRVAVTIGAAILFLVTFFVLLFLSPTFRAAIEAIVVWIFQLLLLVAICIWGLSYLVKGARGNFSGGAKKKGK